MKLTGLPAAVIHFEMMRNRLEHAEESARSLHQIIQLWADGSKVAEAYLRKVAACWRAEEP